MRISGPGKGFDDNSKKSIQKIEIVLRLALHLGIPLVSIIWNVVTIAHTCYKC
jgi:hypothetical protein